MSEQNEKDGGGNVATEIGLYILRSANVILAMVAAVGVLWIKVNVPSKGDFEELKTQVNSLERTVLRMGVAEMSLEVMNKRIDDFEARIRVLERKFPVR